MNVYANCTNCVNCRKALLAEATIYRAAERDSPPDRNAALGPVAKKLFNSYSVVVMNFSLENYTRVVCIHVVPRRLLCFLSGH